jgi:hypothetical protein
MATEWMHKVSEQIFLVHVFRFCGRRVPFVSYLFVAFGDFYHVASLFFFVCPGLITASINVSIGEHKANNLLFPLLFSSVFLLTLYSTIQRYEKLPTSS